MVKRRKRFYPQTQKEENVSIPKSIEIGEVTMLSDGYKVSCAFYKGLEYIKVKGKLKVEVYNWEMSDNVKYSDADTYSLGLKLAEQEFSISPSQLKKETIAFKFEDVIKTGKKPARHICQQNSFLHQTAIHLFT